MNIKDLKEIIANLPDDMGVEFVIWGNHFSVDYSRTYVHNGHSVLELSGPAMHDMPDFNIKKQT